MSKTIDENGIKRLLKNIGEAIVAMFKEGLSSVCNMSKTDTFMWDGSHDSNLEVGGCFHKVSEVVPTPEQLSVGGTLVYLRENEAQETEFKSTDVRYYDGYVEIAPSFSDSLVVIVKEAGAVAGSYIFPETGVYFCYDPDGYVSRMTFNFTSQEQYFNEYKLKTGTLPKHKHKWADLEDPICGYVESGMGSNTLTSDGKDYAGFRKVSNVLVPLDNLTNGGTVKYRVDDNQFTQKFPEGDLTLQASNAGVLLCSDGLPIVVFAYTDNPVFGATTIQGVTEKGVYFRQDKTTMPSEFVVESITVNNFQGFAGVGIKKIDKIFLPDDIGSGSIQIDIPDDVLDAVSTDTVEWNGVLDDRLVVGDYVLVSSVAPDKSAFSKGWSLLAVDDVVIERPQALVDYNSTMYSDEAGSFLIVTKDDSVFGGVTYAKGTYFLYDPGYSITYALTVPDFNYAKVTLSKDYLPAHDHTWKEIAEKHTTTGGNTVHSDGVVYGTFHRVSTALPTLADFNKGYSFRYTDSNNVIHDVKSTDADVSVSAAGNGVIISRDGYAVIVVALKENPTFGAVTFDNVTRPGVYFRQAGNCNVSELVIDKYDGFPLSTVEVIPEEYLPMERLCELFGTAMSDELVWDGNIEGLVAATGVTDIYKISSCVPTIEDFNRGWRITTSSGETIEGVGVVEFGGMLCPENGEFMVIPTDGLVVNGVGYPEKGVYAFDGTDGMTSIRSLYITDYKWSTPSASSSIDFSGLLQAVQTDTLVWDGYETDRLSLPLSDTIMFYHVSDSVFTSEDFAKGGNLSFRAVATDGTEESQNMQFNSTIGPLAYFDVSAELGFEAYMVALAGDPSTVFAGVVPQTVGNVKKGTYFSKINLGEGTAKTKSLQLNSFKGFTRNYIKSEYLPQTSVLDVVIDLDNLTITPQISTVVDALAQKRPLNTIVTRENGTYCTPAHCGGLQSDDSVYFETFKVNGSSAQPATGIQRTYIRVQDKITYRTVTETFAN